MYTLDCTNGNVCLVLEDSMNFLEKLIVKYYVSDSWDALKMNVLNVMKADSRLCGSD